MLEAAAAGTYRNGAKNERQTLFGKTRRGKWRCHRRLEAIAFAELTPGALPCVTFHKPKLRCSDRMCHKQAERRRAGRPNGICENCGYLLARPNSTEALRCAGILLPANKARLHTRWVLHAPEPQVILTLQWQEAHCKAE